MEIYRNQTYVRDELKASFRDRMEEILESIKAEPFSDPEMELLLMELRQKLSQHKGKKVYGYLTKDTKAVVDAIAKKIAAYPPLAELYDQWYEYQCDTFRLYTDKMPEKIPMEENKEFKSVRNMVVKLASGFTLAEPLNGWEESQESYAAGKEYIECGRTTSGLLHLADAAALDPWCEVQLAICHRWCITRVASLRMKSRMDTARSSPRRMTESIRRSNGSSGRRITASIQQWDNPPLKTGGAS